MPKKRQARGTNVGGDHRLLPRVRQLLCARRYSEHLDCEDLLSDLLEAHPEYRRKKRNILKCAIQKAVHLCANDLKRQHGIEKGTPENSAEGNNFSSNSKKYLAYEDTNLKKTVSETHKNTLIEREFTCDVCHNTILNTPRSIGERIGDEDSVNSISHQALLKFNKERIIQISWLKHMMQMESLMKNSTVTFVDIGGFEDALQDISKLLVHLKHPEIYQTIGVTPPRGFLLYGPPGCGKTLIAHAISGELGLPFIEVAATELVSGVSGESESKIRDLFDEAISNAPCILFIDEIDAITCKREFTHKEMEKRIVSQLLKCLDDLNKADASTQVMVIGATDRLDSLDPALRRAGRFDREIHIGIPNEESRMKILHVLCKKLKLVPDFDFQLLAKSTPGCVGSDLVAITREAAVVAINRLFQKYTVCDSHGDVFNCLKEKFLNTGKSKKNPLITNIEPQTTICWLKELPHLSEAHLQELCLKTSDFQAALDVYQPSAKREGFATIPSVTWDDIGALKEAQEILQTAILLPVKNRHEFKKLHLTSVSGILLCGPKGCGKTLLAKAIANECSINFLSVKGPELLNMYVGESEKAVRQCFEKARNSAPCVIFFDEIDALCPRRSHNCVNAVADRVVNQLLTEIDGMEFRKQIFVLGATNRPENIDSAMLRAGRLEHVLFIDLPSPKDRVDILNKITKNGTQPKLSKNVKLESVAMDKRCEGFSGADLTSLVRHASLKAFADYISDKTARNRHKDFEVSQSHFEMAFLKVRPSVSDKERKFFKEMAANYCDSKMKF